MTKNGFIICKNGFIICYNDFLFFLFFEDSIAIGAFHAMAKGILTANSAGNSGLEASSVSSVAPWLFSVAASTTDRLIVDNIILGNGKKVQGISINSFSLHGKKLPLVRGKEILLGPSRSCTTNDALEICLGGCLDSSKVKGKIVLCDGVDSYQAGVARKSGAAGSILKNDESEYVPVVSFPASTVRSREDNAILSYKNSTKNPEAEILKSEAITDSAAPVVTGLVYASSSFNFLLSLAWTMDHSTNSDAEFAYGYGHINLLEAINPRLIYEVLKTELHKNALQHGP
ncbi:hypothetical protein JRO89_XS13G0113300 [Xanthoceras sorbifolium]|uniref:Uncharacterized protein n=1 Tax=Xanthoceras sorbifolium TaxID=99658 RepID=A0ABQ8H7V0_9ROSI|nr:hypothetical protein JRO89_XS13G0113300 [Xanthoceras sorbifolium]